MTRRTPQQGDTASPAGVTAPMPRIVAHAIDVARPMPIVPAPIHRDWMDATNEQFARRCLPLLIANQSGWWVLNSHGFRASWDGGNGLGSLTILYAEKCPPYPAGSMFGHGILTFTIPYLIRTPPGYNLLVRGPANAPKDGIAALEGVVETDWAVATFTMNWRFTRPDHVVTFERDEPICMLVPTPRGELESFQPVLRSLEQGPELAAAHRRWAQSRQRFNALVATRLRTGPRLWQKHYFHGAAPDGTVAPEHQLRLHLRPFVDEGTDDGSA